VIFFSLRSMLSNSALLSFTRASNCTKHEFDARRVPRLDRIQSHSPVCAALVRRTQKIPAPAIFSVSTRAASPSQFDSLSRRFTYPAPRRAPPSPPPRGHIAACALPPFPPRAYALCSLHVPARATYSTIARDNAHPPQHHLATNTTPGRLRRLLS
jgi:hypothetical protein